MIPRASRLQVECGGRNQNNENRDMTDEKSSPPANKFGFSTDGMDSGRGKVEIVGTGLQKQTKFALFILSASEWKKRFLKTGHR